MPADPVLLFHGLGRRAGSMARMARALRADGYAVRNVGYASTCHPISRLVETVVQPEVERALNEGAERVHFVTHSLGGVLVRAYACGHALPPGSRAVMLAPPHGGSDVADRLRTRWPFSRWCGPALAELGTGEASVPLGLGPICGLECGVIAGSRNVYPFLGGVAGGQGDGLVALDSARAEGVGDFSVVRRGHGLIMDAPEVIRQTRYFLRAGRFFARRA